MILTSRNMVRKTGCCSVTEILWKWHYHTLTSHPTKQINKLSVTKPIQGTQILNWAWNFSFEAGHWFRWYHIKQHVQTTVQWPLANRSPIDLRWLCFRFLLKLIILGEKFLPITPAPNCSIYPTMTSTGKWDNGWMERGWPLMWEAICLSQTGRKYWTTWQVDHLPC